MRKWLSSIMHWIEHSETRQLENYLAQSSSHADLEAACASGKTSIARLTGLPDFAVNPVPTSLRNEDGEDNRLRHWVRRGRTVRRR